MAGSRAWYIYTGDDAAEYAVELDEDTGANTALGFAAYTTGQDVELMPRGMKMRYVNAVQTSGTGAGFRSRRFPCGSTEASAFTDKDAVFTLNALQYSVTSTRGERKRRAQAVATGLGGLAPTVGTGTAQGGGGGA